MNERKKEFENKVYTPENNKWEEYMACLITNEENTEKIVSLTRTKTLALLREDQAQLGNDLSQNPSIYFNGFQPQISNSIAWNDIRVGELTATEAIERMACINMAIKMIQASASLPMITEEDIVVEYNRLARIHGEKSRRKHGE